LPPGQQPLAAAKVLPAPDERGQPVEPPPDCFVAKCFGYQSIDPVRLSASGIRSGLITLRVGGRCGGAIICRLLAHQSLEQIPQSVEEGEELVVIEGGTPSVRHRESSLGPHPFECGTVPGAHPINGKTMIGHEICL
jgi:hypothetical protein